MLKIMVTIGRETYDTKIELLVLLALQIELYLKIKCAKCKMIAVDCVSIALHKADTTTPECR